MTVDAERLIATAAARGDDVAIAVTAGVIGVATADGTVVHRGKCGAPGETTVVSPPPVVPKVSATLADTGGDPGPWLGGGLAALALVALSGGAQAETKDKSESPALTREAVESAALAPTGDAAKADARGSEKTDTKGGAAKKGAAKTSDDPAISVKAAATSPPVQLSASATVRPAARFASIAFCAAATNSGGKMVSRLMRRIAAWRACPGGWHRPAQSGRS